MSKNCAALVVLLLLLATAALPQVSTSTVRGVVRDQTQAVIPSATVTLTNANTNVARATQSNEVGIYVFPGVISGPYRITVEATGFTNYQATLTVQVQQDVTVDVALAVGQTSTQVEVKDVTPMVRVDSPALGHDLERQRIEQLPLNGRGYTALLATVPGMMTTRGGILAAYGMRIGSYALTFDGAQMNEQWEGWDFGKPPGLDAIEEFRVEVNSSSAKYTRPTTMVLNSRSGTNQLHGALFETNRNSGYGVARQRQDNWASGKPPYLNRNEYGASAGGPVYIPKVYDGRNRTFWFFGWEGARYIRTSTMQFNVPTEAMRNGDMRGLVDSSGRQSNLYDPMTTNPTTWARQPLSYNNVVNTIDPNRISPAAKYLLSVTQLPTLPTVNPMIDINWAGPVARPQRNYTTSTRIDHRFSDKDLVYGRYTHSRLYEEYQYSSQPRLDGVSGMVNRSYTTAAASMTWVRVISPTLTNELMGSGSWDDQWRGTGDGATDYAGKLGLPNSFDARNWPAVTGMGLGNYAYGQDGPFWLNSKFIAIQDNATKLKGRHEFQFGIHFKHEIMDKSNVPWAGGETAVPMATALYDTNSTASNPIAVPYTGHGMASFYLGAWDYNSSFKRPWWYFRRQEYAPYFQDNIKVTPRLTLNLGLRYEYRTPIYEKNNTLHSFSLDKRAFVVGNDSVDEFVKLGNTLPSVVAAIQKYGGNIITYKDAGMPQRLVYNNWRNFGPRLGLAYRALDGRKSFVVRSGFRVSSYTQPIQGYVGYAGFSAPISVDFQRTMSSTTLSPDGLPNWGLRSVPQYIAGLSSPTSIIDTNDTRTLGRGFAGPYYVTLNDRDPMVKDWNFTVEKEVMSNTVARVAYIGNHSSNIRQILRENEATPSYIWYATQRTPLPTGEYASVALNSWDKTSYGAVRNYGPYGYQNYNGMQMELERRYSNGVGFQFYYLLSNAMGPDDKAEIRGANFYMPGAVPTDFNERNTFVNYHRDNNLPKHQVRWNFIVDVPFGRGKKFAGNSGKLVDKLIGGWQLAGMGSLSSSYWALPTSYWNVDKNIQVYGYQYPIQDCTGGTCLPGYLWWNGYIQPNLVNRTDASGKCTGICGIPSNYTPAAQYMIPWGSTALPPNAPANTNLSSYWNTNTVWIPLNNGTVQRTTFNDNLNPWNNQFVAGPRQWFQDASLFKFVNITEKVTARFNIDFFNVFNNPNNPTGVGSNGVLSVRNSGSGARTTQLTLRLQW